MKVNCIHCETEMKPICPDKGVRYKVTISAGILTSTETSIFICDKEVKIYECPKCGYCEWHRISEKVENSITITNTGVKDFGTPNSTSEVEEHKLPKSESFYTVPISEIGE